MQTVSPNGHQESHPVQISLKRLREIPVPLPDFAVKTQDPAYIPPYIPPALPANKYPAACFNSGDPIPDSAHLITMQNNLISHKEPSTIKVCLTKHMQDGSQEKTVMKNTQDSSNCKSRDVKISQFASGQKETILTTLNKRAQAAPATKAVKVKLLEDVKAAQKTSTRAAKESHSEFDCATTVAAATAAAIASAVPVLKVRSDMEAQVNSVSQLLNKLQEADRHLQRLNEQQSKVQTQPLDMQYRERVTQLEDQLTKLTEQRLQHLEKLQQQQIDMQSHFLSSTVKDFLCQHKTTAPVCASLTSEAPKLRPVHQLEQASSSIPSNTSNTGANACSSTEDTRQSGKSPLETPAPRRCAPVPISMAAQVTQKTSLEKENVNECKVPPCLGKVNSLRQHDDRSSSYTAIDKKDTSLKYPRHGNNSFILEPVTSSKSHCGSGYPTTEPALRKASEVLYDLGSLKKEMHGIIQEAKQWRSQVDELKPTARPSTPCLFSAVEKPQSCLLKTANPPKSKFEDAERILKDVRYSKKVLEDNLEAIIRAKDGAAVYSLISALTTDSNGAEKIRIQKDVDLWISKMNSEIQDELTTKDSGKKLADHRVHEMAQRRKVGSASDLKNIKGPGKTSSKTIKPSAEAPAKSQHKLSGERFPGQHRKNDVLSQVLLKKDGRSKESNESALLNEDALDQIYGKPRYQGHRSTLKKGPYLRFTSPSPKSKPQRPKVVETVRGVKQKSAKVQTGFDEYATSIIKSRIRDLHAPSKYEPQYLFNPKREAVDVNTAREGHLIPMAIPLGRTQSGGAAPVPISVLITQSQPTTVTVSIPPTSPKLKQKATKPNIAVVEMRSEKRDPPKLTVEVLPCVDIDSIASDSTDVSQSTAGTSPPPPAQPDIQLPVSAESEEEILAFPGTSFVQDLDMVQDEEEEDDTAERVLELDGWTDTHPPHYHGIPFPPPAPAPPVVTDILDGIINRKETLENRLVSWVEQEIMARIISDMQPMRADAVPDISRDSSVSITSDIVETAGGEGLQLFVDAGIPVDSGLVRKLVDEALAEIIAVMLGEREACGAPNTQPTEPPRQVPEEAVPTPQCTPPASPPLSVREPSMVKTPVLSPQTSLEEPISQAETAENVGLQIVRSPIHTPPITPPVSPPRVVTPTPPVSEANEDQADTHRPDLTNPWSSLELPLDEENPHSVKEQVQYKDAVVMTVAEDEEPGSLISDSPEPDKSPISPIPQPRSPSPPPSPSSGPSTVQSSLTVTITDTDSLDRPISEGEFLHSYGQIAAARALAEDGLLVPNLSGSLSSTLRDANDMEYDPPSEGQVIHRGQRGAHRDPVLSALSKLNQDLLLPQAVLYHPQDSEDEDSTGEISEGQRPRFTAAAEQVLVGHSAIRGRPADTSHTDGFPGQRPSSPGLVQGEPGLSHAGSDILSSGPMSVRELESRVVPTPYGHPSSGDHRQAVQDPLFIQKQQPPAQANFIQVNVKPRGDLHQGGQEDSERTVVEPNMYVSSTFPSRSQGTLVDAPKKMSLTIPSMNEEDNEDVKSTFIESDSSGADTF
ncbi:protein TALPID3 [Pelobates fuscus]|uniref:protein TALPID3 n=1 Tax=Pelobates fuscus TaxID=191477 RepID=UPI002FE4A5CA